MATVYITEYQRMGTSGFPFQAPNEPENANQTVAIGGTTTQSAAFNKNTYIIRVHSDAICSVECGTNPTATATCKRLPANYTEYFSVTPGFKLAVITNV